MVHAESNGQRRFYKDRTARHGRRMKPQKRISIIIPVLDEGDRIGSTLDALGGLAGVGDTEILIVDGHPDKTTIRTLPAGPVQKIAAPRGRGVQMHAGARASSGKALLFLHADTRLEPDALLRVSEVLRDSKIAGGAFDLGIDASGVAFRLIERGASFRSRLTRIPYGDQAIFLRRAVYFRLGGFRPMPLMEDVDLMRRLKKSGGRIRFAPGRAWTSPRRWKREGILYCTLRNYALVLLYHMGVSPERLARHYRLHGSAAK